ncbi:hypothetical protein AB0C27_07865 [Nonomuraea sp. NPDC048882]|uniref:hypothetical protein n=1 Tax=unclassified Nonomuraea TaxID=2593643 RepID=UPI00340EAA5C
MAKRPTDIWREHVAEELAERAAGLRSVEDSNFAALYPEPLVVATEHVLTAFEHEVRGFDTPSDGEVFAAIQRVVEGLNDVDGAHDDHDYDTIEREELCEFIDGVLSEAGIDLDGLAARRGIERSEITDQWREW